MRKIVTLLSFIVLLASNAHAQTPKLNWSMQSSGDLNEYISSIGSDYNGNIYAVTYYSGDSMVFAGTTFRGHVLQKSAPPFSRIPYEPAVVKMDKNGSVIWIKKFDFVDTVTECYFRPISVDSAGNFILYATVSGTPGMRLVLGTDSVSGHPVFWDSKIYVLIKFDDNGNHLWHADANWGQSFPTTIATDLEGNTILSGGLTNGKTTIQFDTFTIDVGNNAGLGEPIIVKYDAQGKVLWAKSYGGKFTDYSSYISFDPSGNFYISGSFSSDTLFIGNKYVVNSTGGGIFNPSDLYSAKFNANGEVLYLTSLPIDNPSFSISENIYRKNELGNRVLCEITYSPKNNLAIGPSTVNKGAIFCLINGNGNRYHATNFTDSTPIANAQYTKDSRGNLYAAFSFKSDSIQVAGQTLYNNGPGTATRDYFVVKFDTANNASVFLHGGGADDDYIDYMNISENENLNLSVRFKSTEVIIDTDTLTNDEFPFYNMFLASLNIQDNNAGLRYVNLSDKLKIYPNPATNQISIETSSNSGFFTIMNTSGTIVKQSSWSNADQHAIDIENLPAGTYFIRAQSEQSVAMAKFIKI